MVQPLAPFNVVSNPKFSRCHLQQIPLVGEALEQFKQYPGWKPAFADVVMLDMDLEWRMRLAEQSDLNKGFVRGLLTLQPEARPKIAWAVEYMKSCASQARCLVE